MQQVSNMKIEEASISDAENILELQKISYKSEAELYNDFTIPPMTQTIQEMCEDFTQQKFLKAVENDIVIGSEGHTRKMERATLEGLWFILNIKITELDRS